MSNSSRSNRQALNRRELLRLSTAVGVGAVMPTFGAFAETKDGQTQDLAGTCSTPRSAVAKTQYGKVRGYVDAGVLTVFDATCRIVNDPDAEARKILLS